MNNIHDKFNGNLDVKIDEMHHLMLSLRASVESSPMIWPQITENMVSQTMSPTLGTKEERRESYPVQAEGSDQIRPEKLAYSHSPQRTPELSDSEFSAYSPRSSDKFGEGYQMYRRESLTIPVEYQYRFKDAPPQYDRSRQPSNASPNPRHSPDAIPISPYTTSRRRSDRSSNLSSPSPDMLPLPALNLDSGLSNTPHGDYDTLASTRSQESHNLVPSQISATISQQESFKQQLFNNAAVLCEV